MVIRGHAEKGVIKLDEDVALEDGTLVTINVLPPQSRRSLNLTEDDLHPDVKRLAGIIPPGYDIEAMMHEPERFRAE